MTTSNLRDFYPWYVEKQFIEVPKEVVEGLRSDKLYEAAYRQRTTRKKAQYSLDCDDGIGYSDCFLSQRRMSFLSARKHSSACAATSTLGPRRRTDGSMPVLSSERM